MTERIIRNENTESKDTQIMQTCNGLKKITRNRNQEDRHPIYANIHSGLKKKKNKKWE